MSLTKRCYQPKKEAHNDWTIMSNSMQLYAYMQVYATQNVPDPELVEIRRKKIMFFSLH